MRRRSSPLQAFTSLTNAVHSATESRVDFVSGKRHHARRVIDAGGPAQTPSLLGLERALLGRCLGSALARSHARHRQPHRQKVHQRTGHGLRAAPGRDLPPACASSPPSRAARAARTEVHPFPFGIGEMLGIEIVQHGIGCRERKVMPAARVPHPTRPGRAGKRRRAAPAASGRFRKSPSPGAAWANRPCPDPGTRSTAGSATGG